MKKVFLISGVNGIGKSAIIPYLKLLLPSSKYEIHDFDERGVPENAGRDWRISEANFWVNKGIELARENKSIVVCGFIKPSDLPDSQHSKEIEIIKIFLDAQPEIIRQRLIKRYTKNGHFDEAQKVIGKPIGDFIEGNLYILDQMRKMFKESKCSIIDTSDLTPEEVAKEAGNIIIKNT